MKLFKKIFWLINPILIVVFMLTMDKVFNIQEIWMNSIISVLLAFILSPRKKIIQTQNGKIKQITWLFLKQPVLINK
ncbi:hypothetical protein [Polaribacter sp. IC073]|uniref:hypothetical protein n=1 Tax=Polaribacter sp. IC073 TaxID=2508540 RepID=UPI0011BDDE1C|nr:hypothetical protein [Polaribacter sp. IC073]TXD49741.1 hypothetical protein ES045_00725 [Polaribacter sp. IC073]